MGNVLMLIIAAMDQPIPKHHPGEMTVKMALMRILRHAARHLVNTPEIVEIKLVSAE